MSERTEACGRCSVTTVVDAVGAPDEDGDGGDGDNGRNPFDGPRIELPESDLRRVAFVGVWLGRAKRRLDALASDAIYS